jgi:hypothetical protein
MAGIASVGGSLSSVEFQAQRAAATASLQKDALEQLGDSALKLIESASLDGTGRNLNIQV